MKNESVQINLSEKYNLTNIEGMTIHTLLTALADAERMYKKVGMTGLAENAANAHKVVAAREYKRSGLKTSPIQAQIN